VQLSTDMRGLVASRSWRPFFVNALGPTCVAAGFAWALLQPYRVTLLHPFGRSFWWLLSEPPVFVVIVGFVFHWLIAPGLRDDLEQHEQEQGSRR
jgi:hypothetical protein